MVAAEAVAQHERHGARRPSDGGLETALSTARSRASEAWPEISSTIVLVASPTPGDVSRPRAEEAVRAVASLVAAGGERGPVLARDREPWSRLLGRQQEAEPDAVEPVPV